nr:His-Xaa-Ser system radical SAM maturase HxsB [Azospirillum sp. 412522]
MAGRLPFAPLADFRPKEPGYQPMPFRFARIPGVDGKVLVTSEVGEFEFLDETDFRAFASGTLSPATDAYADLQGKHFLVEGDPSTPLRMVTAKYRTRKSFLKGGPALHVFVVTLRCDHSCRYCQVSRQTADQARFDMSAETAAAAIDLMFQTPSPSLTVEFQGGEPLLAFPRIRQIVEAIEERNRVDGRAITYSMTSTLHQADGEVLEFLRRHDFQLSTSLDGPETLHDANRPRPGRASHRRTLEGIGRVRAALGERSLSALTTLTRESLKHPEAIVDEYVRLGFPSVFLRPLSPFGFAAKAAQRIGYGMEEFLPFYARALAYILELNRKGVAIQEAYTGFLLSHILTPFPTGYVDLRSPTGAGLGARVYNYDGGVYASDEGRMLAEMGDHSLRLGTVHDSHADLMQSEGMQLLLATGVAEALPGCSDCAFLPYCGADPVFNMAREGDPVGHRPTNAHCVKHTGLFRILFRYLAEADPHVMRTFTSWVTQRPVQRLPDAEAA